MPTTPRHALPTPASDQVPDVPADMLALAAVIDGVIPRKIQTGVATVTLAAAHAGQADVLFPVAFAQTPAVVATVRQSSVWNAAHDLASPTGVRIMIRHVDGAAGATSGSITVTWLAVLP